MAGVEQFYGCGGNGAGGSTMRPFEWHAFEWHAIEAAPAILPISHRCGYCGLRAETNIGHCDGCGAPK